MRKFGMKKPAKSPKITALIASHEALIASDSQVIYDLQKRCDELKETAEHNYKNGEEWRERAKALEKRAVEQDVKLMAKNGEIEKLRNERMMCLGWVNAKNGKHPLDESHEIPF